MALNGAPVWTDFSGDPSGWKESPWFGWFYGPDTEAGWVLSYEHGDLWVEGPSESDLWLWDFDLGWMWTSKVHYPYIYSAGDKAWLLYLRQTRFPEWYFHFGYNLWTQVGSGYPAPATTTPETRTDVSSSEIPSFISLSDGSGVEMPPIGATIPVTVGRENTDVGFPGTGLQTSGSTRTLVMQPGTQLNAEDVTPRVIFPIDQAGSLVRETINIMRIETVPDGAGGTRVERAFLPVTFHEDGTYSARDFLMPETIRSLQDENGLLGFMGTRRGEVPWESVRDPNAQTRKVRYVTCSFNGSLNYKRAPVLLRMVPTKTPPYRIPYSSLPASGREKADKVFPHNVVVLVHGHNEEEKDGTIYTKSAPWPWYFAYKRDVWTLFYKLLPEYYFTTPADANSYLSPESNTRFYEFIYPSYRGIFNGLDVQLSNQLEAALSPQLDADMPINVVIIAHSMGGLVSRAAIQQFSDRLNDRFMDLMTWGTPHLGSPLVSLRYVLGADLPYDFAFEQDAAAIMLAQLTPGIIIPPSTVTWALKHVLRYFADSAQLDTPGTRDLRYVRRPKQEPTYRLGLENLFRLSSTQSQLGNLQKYDLQDGSWVYNYNLQLMNQNDRHAGSDKYFPVVGRTDRRVQFKERNDYPWIFITAVNWLDPGLVIDNLQYETAYGATVMPLLVADPDEESIPPTRTSSVGTAAESDGAVNTPSMAAMGVSKWVGTAPGWDHEEYYGSPKYEDGGEEPTFTELSKGRGVAKFALERMVGGVSDPNKGYDRYGAMRPPRFGYRFAPGSNLQKFGDELTVNDVGNSTRFEMIGNLNFHPLDEFYAHPFDYIKRDGIRLVSDPERPSGQPVSIPVTEVEIAPATLPAVSPGTSGSYISLDEYAGDNPRIFKGKVDITNIPIANKILRTQIEFVDGSTLVLSPSFIIHSPSIAGTWRLNASLSNGIYSSGYYTSEKIAASLDDFPVDLNSSGQGSISTEYDTGVIHSDNWSLETRSGDRRSTVTKVEGTVSMLDNRLELDLVVEVDHAVDYFRDGWYDEGGESVYRYVDVNIQSYSVMALNYVANFQPSVVVGETWTFEPVSKEAEWVIERTTTERIDGGEGSTIEENFSGTSVSVTATLNR